MWKQSFADTAAAVAVAAAARISTSRRWISTAVDVNFEIRRAVEESFREVSMISPPPKKVNPPPSYSIVKGALKRSEGPLLRRVYGDEEITLSVVRRAVALPSHDSSNGDGAEDHSPGFISDLLLHVGVSRGRSNSLLFLCGLYPDSVGIHSVCLLSKLNPDSYQGRVFMELDEKLRAQLSRYLEDRGVDDRLFPFVQDWLYLKNHHNLVNWFGKLGQFVNGKNQHELVHLEVCKDKDETKANVLP
ncbi:uncharacterized protein LOC122012434 [Zingiber officinale]|uniref:Mitochondrial glycoprotein n=1 Tax=Zingiber officinale TaxID=94328 RepID=A0A8J5LTN8_ZINOF|nr:uncharacterized protein LOC122012434 [Zingiber officinale]KAG6538559.1 hypothetical protein ZIOFF_003683 [Zingiber officinale]